MHQIYGNVKKGKEKSGQGKPKERGICLGHVKTAVQGSFVEICSWRKDWTSQWKKRLLSIATLFPLSSRFYEFIDISAWRHTLLPRPLTSTHNSSYHHVLLNIYRRVNV